jgi:peroxiredoxin
MTYTHALALVLVLGVGGCSRDRATPAPAGERKPVAQEEGEGEAAAFVQAPKDVLVGRRAPAITLELLDGTRVELASLLGKKAIYLKLWATWCVPCREQMPHLEATFRAHGDALAVFAVDVGVSDPIEDVRAMVAEKQLTMPVAYDRDGTVAEQLRLNVTPQHVLIDRDGVVRHVGHAVTPELERAIAALVAGAPSVSPPAVASAPPPPPPPAAEPPPLALDDGSTFTLASPPKAPMVVTFATLFCDSYIVDSRPAVGAACAAHAKQVEALHRAHPELRWVTVAYPVWTSGDDIGDYRKRLGVTVPIGIDRENSWFRRFAVRDPYATILLDANGAELGRVVGDGAGLPALIASLTPR